MKIRLLSILCILLMSLSIEAQTEEFETAAEAVKNMKVGVNLGNTLESVSGELNNMWIEANTERRPQDYETAWGNPVTKAELMKMWRKAGYNAVRVPVSWYPHTGKIVIEYKPIKNEQGQEEIKPCWDFSKWEGYDVDPAWMKRVHEVVDYVIDQGMYCIINLHHDAGAPDGDKWVIADETNYEQNHERFEAIWRQIAEEFKDYDEHLLFEGYNEIVDKWNSWGDAYSFSEWSEVSPGVWGPTGHDEVIEQSIYRAVNKYAQSFVDAVRATGGNNKVRNLIVNVYCGCGSEKNLENLSVPKDEIPNHIAFQLHYYVGVFDQNNDIADSKVFLDSEIERYNRQLTQKGVPLIIGEWGFGIDPCPEKAFEYIRYFMERTRDNGIATFDFNNGYISYGDFRSFPAIINADYINAVMKGYYGDWYNPSILTADDYELSVEFTDDHNEFYLCRELDTKYYDGFLLELDDYEEGRLELILVKSYDNYEIVEIPITSTKTYIDFKTLKLEESVKSIILRHKVAGNYNIGIKRSVLRYMDNSEQWSLGGDSNCNLKYKRKQFVHTIAYNDIWSELNLYDDDIPLKQKNYKGIRVEFAEPINADVFTLKIYADNGAVTEGKTLSAGTSATILFSDFPIEDVINRITLQYCKEGKTDVKVISAWLIRQDGTEEYSDLSPFWGCEIKEKTPYKAAASKEPVYNTFDRYLGGDLSLLPRFEKEGKTYLDDQGNKVEDVLRFLKEEKQFNSIRVRLFVDPSYAPEEHREWGAIQDMEMVKALGKRIKDLGMAFMLDFHYSDTWADPGNQYIPHAWEGLSDEELYVKIYEYTKNSLRELIDAGATPDMIQIGNEVDHGMLWGEYVDRGSSDYSWNRFIRLLKEASKACREVCPQAKIIIHNGCAGVNDLQYFSEKVKEVDYDIVGLSFYLTWDSFDNLKSAFDMFEREFREKDVMVVETNQAYKGEDDYYGYPNTEDGQNNYLNDLIKMLWEYPQVKGLYWWLPEGFRQGLWSEETGKPLAALSTMATFLTQQTEQASNVTSQYLVNPSFDNDLHGWTNTGGTAKWREHTWEALSNFCEFEWTGSAIANQEVVQMVTLPAGSYRLSLNCASDQSSSGLFLMAGNNREEMYGTGGVDAFSLEFQIASETTISLGLKVENTTATWVNFDNFKLERLESTTGIHVISASPTKKNAVIYNLWGQKLSKPQKGINIIDGKKVFIK